MIDAAPNTTPLAGGHLPSTTWGRWFRALADWVRGAYKVRSFNPEFTGVTGAFSAQGGYVRVGAMVYFSIAIDPSTNWAAVAGVSSVGLPLQARIDGVAMVYRADGTASGNGVVASSRVDIPTITTSQRVILSGVYCTEGGE